MHQYDLVLGLPHTNRNGLADHLLLAHAGHFQWTSIARSIGVPLSALRTLSGGEVYATFYFIDERFPEDSPISTFDLDDELRFGVFLRAFKNIAVEGRIVFDKKERVAPLLATCGAEWPADTSAHPTIRFGNIFITPDATNTALRVAPPANADFSGLPPLPNDENPYQLTRAGEQNGDLGLLNEAAWESLDEGRAFGVRYAIDADRDTNGAGLVYFANYIAFMDAAERQAMTANAGGCFSSAQIGGRALIRRRVAYYGNVALDGAVRTEVSMFRHQADRRRIGVRYTITREGDGRLICRSEAIKLMPDTAA